MAATIYDIAREAGVSSSTVARVLRGNTRGLRRDSAERAEKIRRIASDLGYLPNARARAFSEQRTKGVGLLYDNDAWIFEGVNDRVVQGLVRELRRDDHHAMLIPLGDGDAWRDLVLGGQVDGCVAFQRLPDEVRDSIRQAGIPCVMLMDDSDPLLPQVLVDDFGGAYAAARHLIGLGHRDFGLFVHEEVKPHCSIRERRRGVEAAMRDAGLEPGFWHCSIATLVDSVLRGDNRQTALICYSDLESTLLVHTLWQFGLRVPEALSIVGFNEKFSTEFMTPPLTTVGFDAERIGRLGAQLLMEKQLKHTKEKPGRTAPNDGEASEDASERPAEIHRVSTELIVRASTAAPKSNPARIDEPAAGGATHAPDTSS
ncbi:HTH-type transcriptional regulator DegA [Posidoniimonas polymericola]|uniref:HTH-type transcriptional regulator DegA n=1 Tax=Posidoniimonas polymericola TaxID=2528002 RepID=A0A5C5XUJ4_9BACT|nr:LacI family DNA-binding transcriptional regulator [Posidoniimonas polymericola]TWT66976.1 HTH-type transcriptional regulator DegA [Posidoniimonas polymericola]